MSPGSLIVSLDCEGKWGMADRADSIYERMLTDEALEKAYRTLVDLFARFDIPATFAFVMAFVLDEEERRTCASLLRDVPIAGSNWLAAYRGAQERRHLSGWHQPRSFDFVQGDGRHEIASHSFSHLPFDEREISEDDARHELRSADHVAKRKGVILETLVYPRNVVGYVHLLPEFGIRGYRDRLPRRSGWQGRMGALFSEFNVNEWPQPCQPPTGDRPIRIPSGYFFNWRFGLRRSIPKWVTMQRWGRLLRTAGERGEVAHLWFHPHNIITGPETLDVLTNVLRDAAQLRYQGRLSIVTQAQYCRALHANG